MHPPPFRLGSACTADPLNALRYLSEIKANGWHLVDHVALKTKEKMGHWGPTLIDVVALSLGKGFIGALRGLEVRTIVEY